MLTLGARLVSSLASWVGHGHGASVLVVGLRGARALRVLGDAGGLQLTPVGLPETVALVLVGGAAEGIVDRAAALVIALCRAAATLGNAELVVPAASVVQGTCQSREGRVIRALFTFYSCFNRMLISTHLGIPPILHRRPFINETSLVLP